MAEITTAAASATLASGLAAGASGLPPQEVILWAFIGGLVSVWISRKADASLSLRWAAASLMHIGVSAAAGIALSALVLAVAPSYSWLAPIASAPRWVLAGLIAALSIKVGPQLWSAAMRAIGVKEGGNPNA